MSCRAMLAVPIFALLAACGGKSAPSADPEFVDAAPTAAAFGMATLEASGAGAAAPVFAQPSNAQAANVNALVATVVGWLEGAVKAQKPASKSATTHVWNIDTRAGMAVRFTIERLAPGRFNWLAEAKRSAEPDGAYQELLRGQLERDAAVPTAGSGNGILGIDLDAWAAVSAGTRSPMTAAGKVLLGFRHGPQGSHLRYRLDGFTPDPAKEPQLGRYFDVVHATGAERAWTLGAGLAGLGLAGDASKPEKFHARVRQIRGAGGWASGVAFGGDVSAGTALFARECWNAANAVTYRRVWTCSVPSDPSKHGGLDFEAGCKRTTGGANVGGDPASDTSDNPSDDSNFVAVRAGCAGGAEAAADLETETSASAGDASLVRGSSSSGLQQSLSASIGTAVGAPAPVAWPLPVKLCLACLRPSGMPPVSLSVGDWQPVVGKDGKEINRTIPGVSTGMADEHVSVFPPGTFSKMPGDHVVWADDVPWLAGAGPDGGQWTFRPAAPLGYSGLPDGGPSDLFWPPMHLRDCPAIPDGDPHHQDTTFDLTYAIPGSVVIDPTAPGPAPSLLMVYEGATACLPDGGPSFYSTIGIATSDDEGRSWPTYKANRVLPPGQGTQGPNAPVGAWGDGVCRGIEPCDAGLPDTYGRYAVATSVVTEPDVMDGGARTNDNFIGDTAPSAFVDTAHTERGTYLYGIFKSNQGQGPGITAYPGAARFELIVARGRLDGGTERVGMTKWYGPGVAYRREHGRFELQQVLPDGGPCAPDAGDCRSNAGTGFDGGGLSSPILAMDLDGGATTESFQHCQAGGDGGQEMDEAQLSYVSDLGVYLLTFLCTSPSDPLSGAPGQGHAIFYATMDATQYDLSQQGQWSAPQEILGSWRADEEFISYFPDGGIEKDCRNGYDSMYPTFMSLNQPTGYLLSDGGYVFGTHGCASGFTPRTYGSRPFTMETQPARCTSLILCCLQAGGYWSGTECQ